MSAAVIQFAAQRMVCTGCGAEANASCNCGVSYLPKSVRAAEAIKASPNKSNVAIAQELGVDESTVRRVRNLTSDHAEVGPRIGLDGKIRRMPVRGVEDDDEDIEADVESGVIDREDLFKAQLLRAYEHARRLPGYSGPVTEEIASFARVLANAWAGLADNFEFELRKKRRRKQ